MKKTIFIDVPCPVTVRNIINGKHSVYTRLKNEGHRVVLIVPTYAENIIKEKFKAEVIALAPVRPNKIQSLSEFITKHLNMTRMQVLGSKYGLRLNANLDLRRANLHYLRVLISKTLGRWMWFRLKIAPCIHLAAYKNHRPLKEHFEKFAPDVVFTPNMGNPQGEEILREAVRQNVPTFGMVGSWDHPHKRYQALQVNTVFVWSETLKREMIDLQSYKEENVIVSGAPHFDHFELPDYVMGRAEYFSRLGLDPEKKLVTVFSGTGRAPDEGDIVDMLLKYSENPKSKHKIQIFIRSYPGDKEGDLEKFGAYSSSSNVSIDWVDHHDHFGDGPLAYLPDDFYMKEFVSLFKHSEIVLSVYSSASVEASIFGKPTINIAFDGYKTDRPYNQSVKRFELQSHFDKLFSTGAVTNVDSEVALLKTLDLILSTPNYRKNEINRLKKEVCGVVDGESSRRIAEAINLFVTEHNNVVL